MKTRWLGFAALGLLGACGSVDGSDDSELAANAPAVAPLNANAWAASSYESYRDSLSSIGQDLPGAIPDSDPLTVYLAAVTAKIDAMVREDVRKRTGAALAAPKPQVKVLQSSDTFNAWVSGVPVCLGVPFKASGVQAAAGGEGLSLLQRASVFAVPGGRCVPAADKAGALKFWNSSRPECAVTAAGGFLTTSNAACQVPQGTFTPETAVYTTTQHIHFTSDLLAALSERAVTVVAAHELGHYYMSHVVESEALKTTYWYNAAGIGKGVPPRATGAVAAELEAAYREVAQGRPPVGGPALPSRYSARLRQLLVSGVLPLLAERTEAEFPCKGLAAPGDPWVFDLLHSSVLSPQTQASFLAFESKVAACAAKVRLAEPGPAGLSAGATLRAAGAFRAGAQAKIVMVPGDTLATFLERLDADARRLDAKAANLVARARQNQVGLYTTEQAADDFALETATKLGLTADDVLAGWVDFMRAIDALYAKYNTPISMRGEGAVATDACVEMMKGGFKNKLVSLGALEEPHHADCYRLFNLWRHVGSFQEPAPRATPEWDALRAEAARLSSNGP